MKKGGLVMNETKLVINGIPAHYSAFGPQLVFRTSIDEILTDSSASEIAFLGCEALKSMCLNYVIHSLSESEKSHQKTNAILLA